MTFCDPYFLNRKKRVFIYFFISSTNNLPQQKISSAKYIIQRPFFDVNMLMCHLNIYRFQSHRISAVCGVFKKNKERIQIGGFYCEIYSGVQKECKYFVKNFKKMSLKNFDYFLLLRNQIKFPLLL